MEAKSLDDLLDSAIDDLLAEPEPVKKTDSPNATTTATTSKIRETSSKETNKIVKGDGDGDEEDLGFDQKQMDGFFENMKAELDKIDPREAESKINESLPQLFDLMQNILSKELLYPALKDLSPKYDDWLNKNKASLDKKDLARYKKQRAIIDEIIEVFDNNSLNAQEKFERNIELMEKMQSYGSPPEGLTVPQDMSRCSIM